MTATEQLIEHNIRPSVQRVAIMQYLLDHRTHPTADDIYTELVKTMPTLSRTTVYNTLQLLVTNQAKQACAQGHGHERGHELKLRHYAALVEPYEGSGEEQYGHREPHSCRFYDFRRFHACLFFSCAS